MQQYEEAFSLSTEVEKNISRATSRSEVIHKFLLWLQNNKSYSITKQTISGSSTQIPETNEKLVSDYLYDDSLGFSYFKQREN